MWVSETATGGVSARPEPADVVHEGTVGEVLQSRGNRRSIARGHIGGLDSAGSGQPTGTFTSGTLTSQTVYGPGTDNPLAQTTSSGTYYPHADGTDSVTSVTDATQLQSSYRYDPYGVSTEAAGPVSSPYRYAGAAYDVGSGLTYDRARYYDPSTGRFLSKDPAGGGYAYAGDNPVNGRDPSGRSSWVGDDGGGGAGCGGCGTGGNPITSAVSRPPCHHQHGGWGSGEAGTLTDLDAYLSGRFFFRFNLGHWDLGCVIGCTVDIGGVLNLPIEGDVLGMFVCSDSCGGCGGVVGIAVYTGGLTLVVWQWWLLLFAGCGLCIICLAQWVACVRGCHTG